MSAGLLTPGLFVASALAVVPAIAGEQHLTKILESFVRMKRTGLG